MASEADSSCFVRSFTEESSQSRRTKWRSPVWDYCRTPIVENEENPDFLYCSGCVEHDKKPYGSNLPTNMKKHLRTAHQIIVEKRIGKIQAAVVQQLKQLHLQAKAAGQAEEFDSEILQSRLNPQTIDEALISLIIVRNLPFSCVEWPEFHTLCQALNPECEGIISTAHSTITRKVEGCWSNYKDVVRRDLQSAISHIHLSLDIWTSPNGHLLLAICAHYTTHLLKRQKALLALRTVAGHSGENQFDIVLLVLKDYGIVRKLGAIVADNASPNNTLCRIIESYMFDKEDLEWDAVHWRISCIGHIINLAVQGVLFANIVDLEDLTSYDDKDRKGEKGDEEVRKAKFRLLGPLGKMHNIVIHIRSSTARIAEFLALAGRRVPLDNRTRWNSWYEMLVVALDLRPAIDNYVQNHESDLEDDELSSEDWRKLRTIKEFLKPFHRATLYTEGDSAAIDRVLFTMDILIKHFQISLADFKKKKDAEFIFRIQKGWAVFDKYYFKTDMSALYAAALIFHPSRRARYIEVNWPKKWAKPTIEKVKKLWEKYREEVPAPPTSVSFSYGRLSEELKELDTFDQIAQTLGQVARPASQDEYQDYNSGESYDPGKTGALAWWCQDTQRQRWPRLSYMAIDILSIPAMSDEPERVFSGARRTISWERGQMEPETIEWTECLKHWKKSGILNSFIEDELE